MPRRIAGAASAVDSPLHHGAISLSFVGTVGNRSSSPIERLHDPDALTAWLRRAGLLDVAGNLKPTQREYEGALELREVIAQLAACLVDGQKPKAANVRYINEFVAANYDVPSLRLESRKDGGGLALSPARRVSKALGFVAADAMRVFANHGDAHKLVRCRLDDCGAFLLTPAGRAVRLWCSTERCANVAKVRAFRARRAT